MGTEPLRCPRCFTSLPDGAPCVDPLCAADAADRSRNDLPLDMLLDRQFRIGRVLGRGGFGITYVAWDERLARPVAIKECYPQGLVHRGADGVTVTAMTADARPKYDRVRERFLREAQLLARFQDHPGIVRVLSVLDSHGSAYMVMEYLAGETIRRFLERQPDQRISYDEALGLLTPVMEALHAVHEARWLHRDVGPNNIVITTTGRVKLLDFGAARYAGGDETKSLMVVLTEGYAPPEQYAAKGRQGPWTDVYALASMFYRAITGTQLPSSLDRLEGDDVLPPSQLGADIPPDAEQALMAALALKVVDRTPSIVEFAAGMGVPLLQAAPAGIGIPQVAPPLVVPPLRPPPPVRPPAPPVAHRPERPTPPVHVLPPRPRRRARWIPLVVAAVVLLLAGVATVVAVVNGGWPFVRSTGELTGTITGNDGAPLADVEVQVRCSTCSSDFAATKTTDASGTYALPKVPVGHYVATITRANYERAERPFDVTTRGATLNVTLHSNLGRVTVATDVAATVFIDDERFGYPANGTIELRPLWRGSHKLRVVSTEDRSVEWQTIVDVRAEETINIAAPLRDRMQAKQQLAAAERATAAAAERERAARDREREVAAAAERERAARAAGDRLNRTVGDVVGSWWTSFSRDGKYSDTGAAFHDDSRFTVTFEKVGTGVRGHYRRHQRLTDTVGGSPRTHLRDFTVDFDVPAASDGTLAAPAVTSARMRATPTGAFETVAGEITRWAVERDKVTIGVSTKLGTSPPTLSGTLVLTKGVDRLGSALTRLVGDWLSRTSVDDKYTEKDGTKGNDQYHADRETRLHVEEAGADSLLVAMTSHSAFTDHLGRGGAEQKWTRDQQAQFSIAIAADGTLSAKMVSAKTRDEQAAFAALPDAMVRRLELRPTGDLFADFFFKLGSTLSATFKKQ